MFRKLRIVVLLYLLLIVVLTNWSAHERNTDWGEPLSVVIYPINGDRSDKISSYIASLSTTQFLPIEEAMRVQAQHWGVAIQNPFDIKIAPEVNSLPPTPPLNGNPFSIGYWSLRLRYWAWRNDSFGGPNDIRLFVVYCDLGEHSVLAHSLGLQQGFLGVVNGFGDEQYDGRNNVVLAHEMLHTLGASDKYDPRTNQARFPEGFAQPGLSPRYPQVQAEVMAGPHRARQSRRCQTASNRSLSGTPALSKLAGLNNRTPPGSRL